MSDDPGCIFCKIIRGEVSSFKVHEDDRTLAFMDINPIQPGHVLVIPKFHAATLMDTPDSWVAATAVAAQRVARAVAAVLKPDGINLVQANGPGAAQTVMHLHFHVIPRRNGDGLAMNWALKPGNMAEIGRLAERLRAHVP